MTAAAASTLSNATPPGANSSNSTTATAAPRYCDTAPTMNSASGANSRGRIRPPDKVTPWLWTTNS